MASPVNGIYVLQGVDPSQIAGAPVGVKVVETYDAAGSLLPTSQVAAMKGRGGTLLGYFSIGEAESYRSYWSTLPSSMIGPEDPAWPGDYEVAYWTPQWLAVAENAVQTMIAQGYNGAYFDVVNEAFTEWAQENAPNHDPQGAMVALIQQLAAFAHARNPDFQIWINASGAEPMLANAALVETIDGAYEENLFFQDAATPQAQEDVSYNLSLLGAVVSAGKPVVAIEYVSGAAQIASVTAQAKTNGLGYYIANPDLALLGVDAEGFSPPTLTITSAGGATAAAVQTITGTIDVADAGSTVTIHDGTTEIGAATVAADGAWSARVKLTNLGANVVTATASNDAVAVTSNAVTFTLAETPPTVTISSAGGTTAAAVQTIVGTVDVADADSTVTIFDGTTEIGSATVAADGAWSARVTLTNLGANVLTATDANYAGAGTSNAVTYTLAETPPIVTISSAGGTTAAAVQTIVGTVDVADADSTVTILDGTTEIGSATVAADGVWSARVTLTNLGANVLTAPDANYAGAGTSNAVVYTLGTPPTVTIASAGGATASAAQTIAGTVDVADAGSTVTILDGTTPLGAATVASDGAWSAPVTLAMGANVLTATDANAFGIGTSDAVVYTLGTP